MARWMSWMRRREGQQFAILALLLPALLGFTGLVVDVGNVYMHQRRVQNAVDASASAAAMVLCKSGATAATEVALAYAAQNGYNNTVPGTVATRIDGSTIYVTVHDAVVPMFARIVWGGTFNINVRGGARCREESIGLTVIVLDPTSSSALNVNGTTTRLQVSHGRIHVDSKSQTALITQGRPSIVTEKATTIVGNWLYNDRASITPPPIPGSPYIPDPLINLPTPNPADYPLRSGSLLKLASSTFTALDPGTYYGGISMEGSGDVLMRSGVYVIPTGDFKLTGNAHVYGDGGVTIYVGQGLFQLTGGGGLSLYPPASGPYAGVTLFQGRGNTTASAIGGNNAAAMLHSLAGVVYMPAARLDLSGTSDTGCNFDVWQLNVSGNGTLNVRGYEGPGWTKMSYALIE